MITPNSDCKNLVVIHGKVKQFTQRYCREKAWAILDISHVKSGAVHELMVLFDWDIYTPDELIDKNILVKGSIYIDNKGDICINADAWRPVTAKGEFYKHMPEWVGDGVVA